ncbi:hypothetical protein Gotri_002374 [Gossypium trilobum]|uniref:RRM domain-containing protein n=1 Tax=Gossypium trilobum TaxID=34281 RepID=A0A7J9F820_9ROSI|nr:hypothetical protein [Gossypium trilobum]
MVHTLALLVQVLLIYMILINPYGITMAQKHRLQSQDYIHPRLMKQNPCLVVISLIAIMEGYMITLIMNWQVEALGHRAQVCLFGVELVAQENETKEDQEAFPSSQGTSCQVKRISTEDDGSKFMDTSFKSQTDSMHNSRKPTQKALRTLFVNGIPLKSNKREALLSHFRKFGEVIDIYIPKNSERAFVQFSRREEAEAALKAPDAVMGNRFIKLWWANRDSVPDDGINSGSSVTVTSRGPTVFVIPAQAVVNRGGKDNLQPIAQKSNAVHGAAVPSVNSPKPSGVNGPKVQLPLQKKLETLEQMKEELRKKQEMLEQKRNDFRRQLDKLQKQSSGVKGDLPTEQAAKKQKVGIAADPAKASTPSLSEPGAPTTIPCTVGMTDKNKSTEVSILDE